MQGNTLVKAMIVVAVLIFISALALTAYKSGGAALNWQMGEVQKIYPSEDGLYVIGGSNISLVDASGRALWSVPYRDAGLSTYGGGRLLVYSSASGLSAVGKDGNISTLTAQSMNYPPVVGPDGTIFVRSWRLMSALDRSGREMWNITEVISDPVVDGRGYIYLFRRPAETVTEVYLECIEPGGSLRWSIQYPKYTTGTKLLPASAGGVTVYDEPEGILARLSSSGTVSWDHTMPYLGEYSLAEDEYGLLYMFYEFGTVHVINDRGSLAGKFNPVNAYNANLSYMPAVRNGTVYVIGDGEGSATLYAMDIDGSLKWERTFNSTSPEGIYAGQDIVCVGADTESGRVLYVIGDGGSLKFTYKSGDGSGWEQVYIDNGTIYAKTCGGRLYALKG
jgi:hypothetical protein